MQFHGELVVNDTATRSTSTADGVPSERVGRVTSDLVTDTREPEDEDDTP